MKNAKLPRIGAALALLAILASCHGHMNFIPATTDQRDSFAQRTPSPTPVPTDTPTPMPTPTPVGPHMLDDTGCQAMAAADYWNRPVDNAIVASNSLSAIANAASIIGATTAPNVTLHFQYEVVPADQSLTPINSSSGHVAPANYAPPALSGWPVPPDMSTLLDTADHVSVLIQPTNAPGDCRGWDGYSFTSSRKGGWSAYSGDHVEMNSTMYPEVCNGVAALCGEDIEGDLTYHEMNANTGNAPGIVTAPIQHALHTETPCGVAGTCQNPPPPNALSFDQCGTSCARLRLNPALLARPSDPNAAALYDALVHYGMDISENGCCWGFYTMVRADDPGYPTTVPPAVSSFMSSLRITQFDVLQNGSW